MALLLYLPNEVLETILACHVLSARDLAAVSRCCHRLNCVCSSSKLWKAKALKRWTIWLSSHQLDWHWRDIFKHRSHWYDRVLSAVRVMPLALHRTQLVSSDDMGAFVGFLNEGGFNELLEALGEIIEGSCSNVSLKYYGEKAKNFVLRHQLLSCWQTFLARPEEQQFLEEGALLIARYENISSVVPTFQKISDEFDALARKVVAHLEETTSEKPSSSAASYQAPLLPSHLSGVCSWAIMKAICHVLYNKLKFRGNTEDYYCLSNSFIHQVLQLRMGIPITLSIVHIAVARRLGLAVHPVNLPRHFVIKFEHSRRCSCGARLSASTDDPGDNEFVFVDCFFGGLFRTGGQCLSALAEPFEPPDDYLKAVKPIEVFARILRNIIEIHKHRSAYNMDTEIDNLFSSLQLLCTAASLRDDSDDLAYQMLFIKLAIETGGSLNEAVQHCDNVIKTLQRIGNHPSAITTVKDIRQEALDFLNEKRTRESGNVKEDDLRRRCEHPSIRYHVGMIMYHHRFDYVCVIYGWDPECAMTPMWKEQMGVFNLANKDKQPFYHVLVEDGSQRYASQESLQIPTNAEHYRQNPHKDIGRYFTSFGGRFYEPNDYLKNCYPQDVFCVEESDAGQRRAELFALIDSELS